MVVNLPHLYKVLLLSLLTNQSASTGFTFSCSWRRRLLIRSMNQSHTDGAASGDIRGSVSCSRTLGRADTDWNQEPSDHLTTALPSDQPAPKNV